MGLQSRESYRNTLNYWKEEVSRRRPEISRVDQALQRAEKLRKRRLIKHYILFGGFSATALTGIGLSVNEAPGPEFILSKLENLHAKISHPPAAAVAPMPIPAKAAPIQSQRQPVQAEPNYRTARGSYASIQNESGRYVMIERYKPESPELDRMVRAEHNAVENKRLLADMEYRDRQCAWWKSRALNYDLITVRDNVERYCKH